MAESDLSVEVIESYQDYEPPLDVAAVARDLLAYVPPKGLMGLGSVYKKYWYLRPLFHLLGWLRRRFNWFQRPT